MKVYIKIAVAIIGLGLAVYAIQSFKDKGRQNAGKTSPDAPSQSKGAQQNTPPNSSSTDKPSPAETADRKLSIDYAKLSTYEFWDGANGTPDMNSADQYIIARYQDNRGDLVIPSVRATFPDIFNSVYANNQTVKFRIFQLLQNKKVIILEPYTTPGYKTAKVLFRYDTQSGEVKKLAISDFLFQSFDQTGFQNIAWSDNSGKLLFAPNLPNENGLNQIMYVVNLDTDTYQEFMRLDRDNTFNAGSFQNPVFDMLPQGNGSIRVGIFLQSLKKSDYNPLPDKGKAIVQTYKDLKIP